MSTLQKDWKELQGLISIQPEQILENIKNCEMCRYAKTIYPYWKTLTQIYGEHNFDIERNKKWDWEVF